MQTQKALTLAQTPVLFSKDFYEWPDSWMGFDEDLTTGNEILKGFVPFIQSLVNQGASKKTIKNHMGNLWVLGSEIISGVHYDEEQRTLAAQDLLLEYVEEEGGPLVHQWDPNYKTDMASIKSYDATCRKLYKFLKTSKITH